ncbi:MAG: MFS transporter [Myxococcales bacterium]|nr:MAG: MFS transporter [Myxococcales bacterium]
MPPATDVRESTEPPLFTRDFALILATQFTFGFAFSSFLLLPKYVVTVLHGSPSQVGYVGALAVLTAVLVSPPCGKLLDRGRRVPLVLLGCLLSGFAALGFLFVTEAGPYLYGVRAVQGVAYTLYYVAAGTLVADLAPPSRLGQALGWFGAGGLLMNAIATLIAEAVAAQLGWNAVFYAAAASGFAAALLSLFLREPERAAASASSQLEAPLKPAVRRHAVLWGAAAGGAAFGALFTFTQPLALSLGDSNMSPLFGGYTAAALLVRLGFGNLADRVGRARVGGGALGVYALVVAMTAGLARGWLAPLGVGFGLAHGAFYPSLNALALEGVARGERGSAGAWFNAAFNTGVLLVTFCFGHVAQLYGYRSVFLVVACLCAGGCFVVLGQSRKPLARSALVSRIP